MSLSSKEPEQKGADSSFIHLLSCRGPEWVRYLATLERTPVFQVRQFQMLISSTNTLTNTQRNNVLSGQPVAQLS